MKKSIVLAVIAVTLLSISFAVATLIIASKCGLSIIVHGNAAAGEVDGIVFLAVWGKNQWSSYAKAKLWVDMNLDSIENISFNYLKVLGCTTPYIVIEVDTDGDSIPDTWLVQYPEKALKPFTWVINDNDDWRIVPGSKVHYTLSEIKAMLDGKVTAIKIAVGWWKSKALANVFFVAGLQVNGQYLLNPP